jgi:hypothetical protein
MYKNAEDVRGVTAGSGAHVKSLCGLFGACCFRTASVRGHMDLMLGALGFSHMLGQVLKPALGWSPASAGRDRVPGNIVGMGQEASGSDAMVPHTSWGV